MRRLVFFVMLVTSPLARAAAQADGSLGVGVGTVRYPGGSSFSSAAFSPTAELDLPRLTASGNGLLASLPGGTWSLQGRGDVWAETTPLVGGIRLGAEGIAAGSRRSGGAWTAAAHGIAEVLWARGNAGVGLGAGPSAGWIRGEAAVTAPHVRARGWWQSGRLAGAASVEPTRFPDGWFTDVSTTLTLTHGSVVASLWVGARASATYGSTAAASGFVQLFLSPSVSLELGGGSYLRDPYQGFDRAGYVTATLRFHARPRAALRATHWSPLVPSARGDSLVVRFHMAGARSVAIGGDWNGWTPIPLHALGDDRWEGALSLAPGVYHFELLVDGDWVVPRGVLTVPDGLGGLEGVLVVQ